MAKDVSDSVYSKKFGRTICEVHRELYDILDDELRDHPQSDILKEKLQEAYSMAKKMDAKLRQNKHDYDNGWWEKERDMVVKDKLKKREGRN